VNGIGNDIVIEKIDISAGESERRLNGDYPITAMESKRSFDSLSFSEVLHSLLPDILGGKILPYDAKNNPDKYILPLDIVIRKIAGSGGIFNHYAIYVGNKCVAHLPGGGEPTKFDT